MTRHFKAGGFLMMAMLSGGTMLTASANGMQIAVTYDPSVTSSLAPAQVTTFENAFNAVASQFGAAITNNITVNIDVNLGMVNSFTALPTGAVSGSWVAKTALGATPAASFANTVAALAGTGDVIPGRSPTGNTTFYMPQAEIKALALSTTLYPLYNAFDGYIGFAGDMSQFSFSATPSPTQYSFVAAAEHEIEEVLGRTSFLNNAGTLYQQFSTPMDLLRYSAPDVTSYTVTTPNGATSSYASTDGGVTDLGTFADQATGGDRTDWQTPINTTSTDAQNALLSQGNEGLSISDARVLQGLGYTVAANNGGGLFSGANAPVGATASVNASQPVPEPASLTLLAVAAGLTRLMRRRNGQPVSA